MRYSNFNSHNHISSIRKLTDNLRKDRYSQMEYSASFMLTLFGIFCIAHDFPMISVPVLIIMTIVMFLVLRQSIVWGWTNCMREDDIRKKRESAPRFKGLNLHDANKKSLAFSSEKEVCELLERELFSIQEKKSYKNLKEKSLKEVEREIEQEK